MDSDISLRQSKKSKKSPMNSGLKRSFSSPDFATDTKELTIDTSSKPRLRRKNLRKTSESTRAFLKDSPIKRMNPIYRDTSPGTTGLKNLGNTCYMSSIIQCISNTPHLSEYFISDRYKDHLNIKNDNKIQEQLAEQFAQVIKALWRGQYKSFSPTDFKDIIGEYKLGFKNCDQQDAHEFLTFFLEWIHGDLKRDIAAKEEGSLSSAEEEWLKLSKGQSSIISDLFTGQLRSTICCSVCRYKSETYEIFTSLSLSLPAVNHCTLNECLRDFFRKRRIDGWDCPQCKTTREAMINYDLVKLAQNLIVHLKRFTSDNTRLGKKDTSVVFPLRELNLKPYFVIDPESLTAKHQDHNYHLYALANHYGTMNGGHYTAFCKNAPLNEWYKYDDSSVHSIIEQDVASQKAHAYLLFYTSQVEIANQSVNKKPGRGKSRLPSTLQTGVALKSVQIEKNEALRDGEKRSNLSDNVANSESDASDSELQDLVYKVYPRKVVLPKPSKRK